MFLVLGLAPFGLLMRFGLGLRFIIGDFSLLLLLLLLGSDGVKASSSLN